MRMNSYMSQRVEMSLVYGCLAASCLPVVSLLLLLTRNINDASIQTVIYRVPYILSTLKPAHTLDGLKDVRGRHHRDACHHAQNKRPPHLRRRMTEIRGNCNTIVEERREIEQDWIRDFGRDFFTQYEPMRMGKMKSRRLERRAKSFG